MPYRFIFLFILSSFIHSAYCSKTPLLRIAAASDLKFALADLIDQFSKELSPEQQKGEIQTILGPSGKLFHQIKEGAPFDLFFSADVDYPHTLAKIHTEYEILDYAIGRIVIWSEKYQIKELIDLKDNKFKKIAIANPLYAPYGKKALEALNSLGIYSEVKDRLVFAESISHAAQFIHTEATDAGIVALSLLLSGNLKLKKNFLIIPKIHHTPLVQGLILLNKKNNMAKNLFDFMKTPKAKLILKKYGFETTEDKNGY